MLVGIYILQRKYFKTMPLKDWNCFATCPLTLGSGAPGFSSFSVKPSFLLRYVFRIIIKQRLENTWVWTIAATETMMAMLDTRMSKAPTMMVADLKLVQPQHLFLSSGGIIAPSISAQTKIQMKSLLSTTATAEEERVGLSWEREGSSLLWGESLIAICPGTGFFCRIGFILPFNAMEGLNNYNYYWEHKDTF